MIDIMCFYFQRSTCQMPLHAGLLYHNAIKNNFFFGTVENLQTMKMFFGLI
jgi:hypothetical protein